MSGKNMKPNKCRAYTVIDCIAECGQLILLTEGSNILLTSVLFLCNIPVTPVNFILSLLIAVLCYGLMCKGKQIKDIVYILIVVVMITLLAIAVNWFIQDIASDGNFYHKLATGFLRMGWNPVYDQLHDYYSAVKIPNERIGYTDIWVACYPKASWYFDASVYTLTNSADAAKIFNVFTFIAVFGICWNYFKHKVRMKSAIVLSIIFTGIPVSYAQMFTYYLDGALGQLLLASVIILLALSDECFDEHYKKKQWVYLAICIILCSNLKSTGLAFEAVFCAVFFVYWCCSKKKGLFKICIYYIGVVFTSLFIVGASTYIRNWYDFGNPLYPTLGFEIFSPADYVKSLSDSMKNASPFRQLITMLFVRARSNGYKTTDLEWKLPFAFNLDEFARCEHDNIRGGGGVFYSGILIVSIIAFVAILFQIYKLRKAECTAIVIVIATSMLLMFVMPAGGVARYSPYIYFLPYFTLYLWALHLQDGLSAKKQISGVAFWIMCAVIFINSFAFSEFILRGIIQSCDYALKYETIQASEGVYIDTKLPGTVFNFIDRNITYEYKLDNMVPDGEMKYLQLKYEIIK